jgi:hypothetical protein
VYASGAATIFVVRDSQESKPIRAMFPPAGRPRGQDGPAEWEENPMTLRFAMGYGLGIAALVGVVGTAGAQVTSDQRVRVVKDAPGDVVTRVDTITITRVDTVRVNVNNTVYRTDTVRVAGPTVTNTVTRYDTTTMEVLPGWMKRPSGMYFGLGVGPMYPGGSLFEAQTFGYTAQMHLGVDPAGSPLGIRFDANYAHPDEGEGYHENRVRPEIINLSGDLTLKAPALSQRFPLRLYALGGGTYTRYKDLAIQLNETTAGTFGDNVAMPDEKWHDKYGFNAGLGATLGWGKTELFIEGRLFQFNPSNAAPGQQKPLVIGINWY